MKRKDRRKACHLYQIIFWYRHGQIFEQAIDGFRRHKSLPRGEENPEIAGEESREECRSEEAVVAGEGSGTLSATGASNDDPCPQ